MSVSRLTFLLAATAFVIYIFGQTAPPLSAAQMQPPEDARHHEVIGSTLLNDAKTADDFSLAILELKQAAELAPQWPEARYKLALAKEAAGDYPGAMEDLKIYLQMSISAEESRKAQDEIYVLEAKKSLAAKTATPAVATKEPEREESSALLASSPQAENNSPTTPDDSQAEENRRREFQEKLGFLEGTWNCKVNIHAPGGFLSGMMAKSSADQRSFPTYIKISGRNISIRSDSSILLNGTIEGDNYTSIKWVQVADKSGSRKGGSQQGGPVDVTVDKSSMRISWRVVTSAQDQGLYAEMELTK